MNYVDIPGPLGPFRIPSEPDVSRESTAFLSRGVFDGEYDHPELPADIKTILDIGSGWGAFAVWARALYPDAAVECYDPHELGCEFARANAPWAMVHNMAVTTDPAPQFWPGTNWGSQRTRDVNPDFAVPCVGVHPRDLPPCDLLKCDAEGVEDEVLGEYAHAPRVILYEWHTTELRRVCAEIVRRQWPEMRCLAERPASWGDGNGVAVWLR